MKKLAIMAALVLAVSSASALEVGVRGTLKEGANNNSFGVVVGQKFGKIGIDGAFDRSTQGPSTFNKWSVVGSYDIATIGGMTIAPKLGVALIDPSVGPNGSAWMAGVGATYPLTKKVSLTADYFYQKGQDRVSAYDGNRFMFGARYSF